MLSNLASRVGPCVPPPPFIVLLHYTFKHERCVRKGTFGASGVRNLDNHHFGDIRFEHGRVDIKTVVHWP